jgi:hypothetical protein
MMPVSVFPTARIPIECFECDKVALYLVRDLVGHDGIACAGCKKPIDLSTDQWRAALQETADYYKAILIG